VVGVQNLHVVITKTGSRWFAHGIEIGYGADGADLDDVRRAFEFGLAATINAHLKKYGSIKKLLGRPAPPRVRALAEGPGVHRYSQISTHLFPFQIEFLKAA